MFKKIEQWFFPYICCLCEQYSKNYQDLCQACKDLLPWVSDRCYRCGSRLREDSITSYVCRWCEDRTFYYDRLMCAFDYLPPIIQLISGFKYGNNLVYGRILGKLLAEACKNGYQNTSLPQAIIPVPLHIKRLRKRGFNQSFELAKPVSECLNLPIRYKACQRHKNTLPQAGLNAYQRQQNLKQAFLMLENVSYEHIAIVDDIVTTGSTVNALSKCLKEAGIEKIDIWCISRQ